MFVHNPCAIHQLMLEYIYWNKIPFIQFLFCSLSPTRRIRAAGKILKAGPFAGVKRILGKKITSSAGRGMRRVRPRITFSVEKEWYNKPEDTKAPPPVPAFIPFLSPPIRREVSYNIFPAAVPPLGWYLESEPGFIFISAFSRNHRRMRKGQSIPFSPLSFRIFVHFYYNLRLSICQLHL